MKRLLGKMLAWGRTLALSLVIGLSLCGGICFGKASGGGYGSSPHSSSSSSHSYSSSSRSSGGGYGSTSHSAPSSPSKSSGGGYGSSSSKTYSPPAPSSPSKSTYSSPSSGSGWGSSSKKTYSAPSDVSTPANHSDVSIPSTRHYDSSPSSGGGGIWVVPLWFHSKPSKSSQPVWDEIYSTVGKSPVVYTNAATCDAALRGALYSCRFMDCPHRPTYVPAYIVIPVVQTNLLVIQTNIVVTNAVAQTNLSAVATTNAPVGLVGGKWGYVDQLGKFTPISKDAFILTTAHLVKYGYDPNPSSVVTMFMVVFGLIIVLVILAVILVKVNGSKQRRW